MQRLGELGADFPGLQPLAVRPQGLGKPGEGIEQREIVLDCREHPRAEHLDRDLAAVGQLCKVNLGDRRRGHRRRCELGEQFAQRASEIRFDRSNRLLRWKRRHAVLQLGQLIGDVERQQVAAGGQNLAELDEDRTQRLQRQPQPDCRWLPVTPPEADDARQPGEPPCRIVREHHLVEPEAARNEKDSGEAEQAHGGRGE